MTDLEQTCIRSAITEVLPDLPEMTEDILEETLQSLGVETYEDFQFVKEADLPSALRPFQARKVLVAWKLRRMYTCDYCRPSASLPSYSPRRSSFSCKGPDIDWMDSFVIPWDKFPEELMQALERGKRPRPRMRREMGKRLLNYRNTVAVYKSNRLLQAVPKFKVMRGELSGCSEDVKDMVLLLLSYFDEKEDMMLCYVEDTCLAGEVPMDQVQLTPTIVVCVK
ncbi:hypothetical protein KUCAC02_002105 [Chaenocephalus aceratus]|uniref:Uncharacterized protein n=1 Tax=Chaenocephalus aceratus TaxID=36190 RepID=A0ACB9XUQ6_CHAAC|nr:hypothetical protein KUCAC02_002105 [Chaenocephalus aceratus]